MKDFPSTLWDCFAATVSRLAMTQTPWSGACALSGGGSHGGVHAISAEAHQQRCTVILLPHDHALSLCLTTHCSRQVRTLFGTSPYLACTVPTPAVGMVWNWYGQSMGGAWAKRGRAWAKCGRSWTKCGRVWAKRGHAVGKRGHGVA